MVKNTSKLLDGRIYKCFNISISHLSFDEFLDKSMLLKGGYNCFLNSHMIYEHYKNPAFKGVLSEASFVLPDGMPLLYTFRWINQIKQERIAGNDVIFSLVEKAKKDNLSIYLIGSTEEILRKISIKLENYGIRHFCYSPPFTQIKEFDFKRQAQMINNFNPDLIMVGLGCPKQEIWMSKMKDKIQAPMYGLGGAFLLYAGIDSRAPKVMRNFGLEWIYRLALEPTRLFKRYLTTNTFFIILVVKELIKRSLKSH